MNRIGPQMARAVAIVESNPGCSKLFVASRLHIGAAKGTNYAVGYNPVNRAIRAGLISANFVGNRYELTA